ncbi:mitochondrial ubiquitin ligase activator of nfkb 1-A isoform X1 [Dunckerocampus dactyliophorus]|uniref:mitochondrial ubiquitin ligase activator of nfkb 1-A isoform X1 n=1 Tax=Dunckerocampus dactyliophorus TaxID=161453 RepID=UPI002406F144|nr:mitochondrial ubiquitin ligase activator of nfkb 1-A isoform X1 [Dunckerocampus dactyliophorus]
MGDFSISTLVLLGVGSSFAFSGLFHHLYQQKKKELTKLKEIPVFRPDEHLYTVLKSSPHRRLQYVAVEGLVQAGEKPLSSQFVPRCFGVLQKIVVQEHGEYWNSLTKTWYILNLPLLRLLCTSMLSDNIPIGSRSSRRMNSRETNNSVPFSLVCPGSYITDFEVKVQEPSEGSGYFLERVYHRVRRAEEGLVNVVLQGISGERPVAMEESEEMLRVGSILTVFGEVVMEGGHGRVQAPKDGREYLLIPTPYKSYIERHERSASMWKKLTAVTGITGASLLAGVIYSMVGTQDDRSK